MKSTNIKALLHAFLIGISLLSLNTRAGVEITYIYNDALGTPIAGADEQGNVKWRAHYQPYGVELLGERQLFGVRAGYTGQRDDPETGLTYVGARYYSPTIGRFMGVDPAGVSESNIYSFNRYAYANNNPYRFVDPNGESPVSVGLIFIARETGIGYGLGVIADSISQYAAFGEVDIQLALTSNAAIAGGEAGLFSGVVRSFVSGISAAKSAGNTLVRTTRAGDKAIRTTRPDGSVIDISPKRVKEFVPNTNPKAPPGALNRVKFDNAMPGSKGFKRPPTQQELDTLENAK